jgi:hemin uptake protein HemP
MGMLSHTAIATFSPGELQTPNENAYHLSMSEAKQIVSPISRLRMPTAGNAPVRTLPSEELFRSERQILIRHAGSHYCLRITQHGKLILTK